MPNINIHTHVGVQILTRMQTHICKDHSSTRAYTHTNMDAHYSILAHNICMYVYSSNIHTHLHPLVSNHKLSSNKTKQYKKTQNKCQTN